MIERNQPKTKFFIWNPKMKKELNKTLLSKRFWVYHFYLAHGSIHIIIYSRVPLKVAYIFQRRTKFLKKNYFFIFTPLFVGPVFLVLIVFTLVVINFFRAKAVFLKRRGCLFNFFIKSKLL
jgi:hypothetical protein